MQGIKKNLLYWGYTMEYQFIIVMVTLLLICFLNSLDNLENFPAVFMGTIAEMGLLYMVLIVCIAAFTYGTSWMPFTLSMGSTRKDSFVGMQIMQHVLELQVVLLILLTSLASGKVEEVSALPAFLCVYGAIMFFAIALANFISAAVVKFGRGAGLAVYFAAMVILLGVVAGMVLLEIPQWLISFLRGPIILPGLFLDIVSMAILYKPVKTMEVKM